MAEAETSVLASESAVWVHCTPLLITKGPMLCGVLPRQPCQCSGGGSHDHLVDAFWAQQNRVPPAGRGEGRTCVVDSDDLAWALKYMSVDGAFTRGVKDRLHAAVERAGEGGS